MPFNYFNPSHLAFGSKLTRAFRQLESLTDDVENLIDNYSDNLQFFSQYINRNYRIPFPVSGDNPTQVDQLFDLINDEINIRELEFYDGKLHVAINYFNRGTNRFTIASGETELKTGYAYMKESISNSNPTQTITFSENESGNKGLLLFQYAIDSEGRVNINQRDDTLLRFKSGGIKHVRSMRLEEISLPHTATEYEAILIQGILVRNGNSINFEKNGKTQVIGGGTAIRHHAVAYLKPDDTLKGITYNKAYKIIYESADSEYVPPEPTPTPKPEPSWAQVTLSENCNMSLTDGVLRILPPPEYPPYGTANIPTSFYEPDSDFELNLNFGFDSTLSNSEFHVYNSGSYVPIYFSYANNEKLIKCSYRGATYNLYTFTGSEIIPCDINVNISRNSSLSNSVKYIVKINNTEVYNNYISDIQGSYIFEGSNYKIEGSDSASGTYINLNNCYMKINSTRVW